MFGPKVELVKLHNEELHNVFCPLDSIRSVIIKSMRMSWALGEQQSI
jgi:hypothetical protein